MNALIFLLCVGIASARKQMMPNRPNIVMVLADDMGYQDVGFRGSDIMTPNLDRLANEGVILENHYVMPQCSPTRSSLMSGRHAIRTGFWKGNIKPNEEWGLRLNETTIPEMLNRNGYATHGIGKWHCGLYTWGHTPAQRGFDTYLGLYLGSQGYFSHKNSGSIDFRLDYHDENGHFVDDIRDDLQGVYSTDIYTERAVSVISQHDSAKPLFVFLSYTAPHGPLEAPLEDIEKYSSHMSKSSSTRKIYATTISVMDRGIGDVVDALQQHGLWENTLFIFTSDNGGVYENVASNFPLRGGKESLQEGGVRALSFVNSPLLQKSGYINTNLHHVTDWYKTFQALARDQPEQAEKVQLELDGVNIWKSISQNKSSGRDEVLLNMRIQSKIYNAPEPSLFSPSDYGPHKIHSLAEYEDDILDDKKDNFFVIRRRNWKLFAGSYIEQGWTDKNNLKNMRRREKSGKEGDGIKLFDLSSDPREKHDVSKQNPEVVEEIMARLASYKEKMTWIGKRHSSNAGRKEGIWYPWVALD